MGRLRWLGQATEFVDDQQLRHDNARETRVPRAGFMSVVQLHYQGPCGHEQRAVIGCSSGASETDGEVGLAHPRWSQQQHVFATGDPTCRGQVVNLVRVDARLCFELKVLRVRCMGKCACCTCRTSRWRRLLSRSCRQSMIRKSHRFNSASAASANRLGNCSRMYGKRNSPSQPASSSSSTNWFIVTVMMSPPPRHSQPCSSTVGSRCVQVLVAKRRVVAVHIGQAFAVGAEAGQGRRAFSIQRTKVGDGRPTRSPDDDPT